MTIVSTAPIDKPDIEQTTFGVYPHYLAALVIAGKKQATSSGKLFYHLEQVPLPLCEAQTIFTDMAGQPLVQVKNVAVYQTTLGEMPERWAFAEGEGDYAYWQKSHRQFFNRELSVLEPSVLVGISGVKNQQVTDEFEIVYEQFERVTIFPKTYTQWLAFAEQTLTERGENDPYLNAKQDANLLLQAVTKRTKSALFAFAETQLTETELQQLASLLVRRAEGEPMAYILGEKEFWSLPLSVSPATLIPRPDTERLVELALAQAHQRLNIDEKVRILDLGTGTGAIALALASELGERAEIIGVDKSLDAVVLAESNRQALGFQQVSFRQSDWFSALSGQQFDIIVSNPPYIDPDDEHLNIGDVRFEPRSALVAEQHGLSDLQKIIEFAPLYLRPSGALLLEHGWQQASAVQQCFQSFQWQHISTAQDYGGHDRVTSAIWNSISPIPNLYQNDSKKKDSSFASESCCESVS